MRTIPDPRPPDAQAIAADLDALGIAVTADQQHVIDVACECGCGGELRSLMRTVAVLAPAPRTPAVSDLPPWITAGVYEERWRGGWWLCRNHDHPASRDSSAWTSRELALWAARHHVTDAHTPGEPAQVRNAYDAAMRDGGWTR